MVAFLTQSGDAFLTQSGDDFVTQSDIADGAQWPASLPQAFLLGSYRQSRPKRRIESQPEVGDAIVRLRTSLSVMPFSGAMMMTTAQRIAFDEFFDDTLQGGTAVFAFPAQDGTGGTWDVRFTSEPEEEPVTAAYWRVTMALVSLP